jgi:hypothetical protein
MHASGVIVVCLLAFLAVPAPVFAADGEISVQGNKFLRDGKPWIARGVTIVGVVAPEKSLRGPYVQAHKFFGPAELDAAKQYGADLIRFQVSQAGSNKLSGIYSDDYLDAVKSAVALARGKGFSVIVSLQSEKPSGVDETGMPNEKAVQAWQSLAPLFGDDRGVMLEIFNEPSPNGPDTTSSHDWDTWQKTMQPLVDEIRRRGARNVLLLDGLYWSQVLDGAPRLNDPLSQVAYAEHPYMSPRLRNRQDWESMFGRFASNHPVMVTEWNATGRKNCIPSVPQWAADMLAYLHEHQIGLVGWAFDLPGTLSANYDWSMTNYNGFYCGPVERFGAGELIHNYFMAQ